MPQIAASVIRQEGITTAQRDSLTVTSGEFWKIYNTTTAQWEYWNGSAWVALDTTDGTVDFVSNVATARILGRITAGSGNSEELTATQVRTLLNVEDNADVTDNTNVNAAGAVMEADTSTSPMQFVIDEDNLVSDSDTKVPTQQSVKAYVDNAVTSEVSYKGGYNAATNTPDLDTTPIATRIGDMYTVTAAGTFFTVGVEVGDVIIAEIVNATVEADWTILQSNLDAASIKVLYESNADTNAFTDSEQTNLGNQSNTNTGDNATNSQYSGLVSNVTTDLSEGTTTNTTVDVNSSDGTNATLVAASTSRAGVMTKAKFDEVEDNKNKFLIIAFSDETTAIDAGTGKVTFTMPNYATTLTGIAVSFVTAPTTSVITIDVNEAGTSVLSTKITVDATEFTSEDAATPPVISDSALAANAIMSVDVDTADSGGTSAGGKLIIYFTKT